MPPNPDSALATLMSTLPRPGTVRWIGLRPARAMPMAEVERGHGGLCARIVADGYLAVGDAVQPLDDAP